MSGLVKHYQNTMKGIPQLTNNWGAMITLLDAVLVTGFNYVSVVGLTKANATSITATINLGSNHGFIDRQVVRIAGSTNGWDGDYKVLSVDGASITIECTAQHPSVILGTVTCFTAPLDFEIVYQTPADSIEPKRAYRSTDPESLGLILLVHDFCVSGASATGAKFAKVGIVEGVDSNGNVIGNFMPFNSATTNENWGWDGTYHGRAKWYYAAPDYDQTYDQFNDTVSPNASNRIFTIAGDGISFSLAITNHQVHYLYGVAEFFDYAIQGQNLMLAAASINTNVAQSQGVRAVSRCALNVGLGNEALYGSNQNQRAMLWYNSAGLRIDTALTRAVVIGYMAISTSPTAITNSNTLYTQAPIIDSSNIFHGVMPFVRLQYGPRSGDNYTEDGLVRSYSHINGGGYGTVNFGLSLEMK